MFNTKTESYRPALFGSSYKFQMKKMSDGSIRIYILRQPSYNGRATDGHNTHRLNDGTNYICILSGREPTSFEDARSWYRMWTKGTEYYIKHGKWNV